MASRARRRQVTEILERGAAQRTPFFIARTIPGSEAEFTVAAGKRAFRRAVDRNRARRRLAAAARLTKQDRPGRVIIARAPALTAPFDAILSQMEKLGRHDGR